MLTIAQKQLIAAMPPGTPGSEVAAALRTEHSRIEWSAPNPKPGKIGHVIRRGAEMFHDAGDGRGLVPSNFSKAIAGPEDAGKCKIKFSNCHNKTGISDGAGGEHIVGYKVSGHQLKMSPRKITLWNSFNNSHVDLFEANTSGFNAQTGEFENYYPGINLKFAREAGQMRQSLVVNFPSAFQHHYELGNDPAWELAYWTEIEHPDTLAFLFTNGTYAGAPGETIKSGTWDETRDLEVDAFLIYRRWWEKGRDLLYFPQQTIREVEQQPSMDKPGKMIITKEAIREKMRLVKRDGKTYLVESIPMSFAANWDYVSSPLPLNYTTLSGGLTQNENWTNGTYLVDAAVTLGTYNLSVSGTAVIKNGGTTKCLQVNSTGTLIVTGTAARKVYFTSANDDTVGEAIAGSTGIPSTTDVRAHILVTSTSSTITANYATFRYSGWQGTYASTTFGINNAQMPTFTDCYFEYGGSSGIVNRSSTYTGTSVTFTRCVFVDPGSIVAQADNIYAIHIKVYGILSQGFTVLNGAGSYIKNCFMPAGTNTFLINLNAGNLLVTNFETFGRNESANSGVIICSGGTLTLKYSIICKNRNGVWASGGTINHSYNIVHQNTANFTGTAQDGTESIANPDYVWPVNSCVPMLRTGAWGLTQTTPDTVNAAGYEYLVNTFKAESKTLLAATNNIPFGFCDWEDVTATPAVTISLRTLKGATPAVQFQPGETAIADGSITSNMDVVGLSVTGALYDVADVLVETLFTGNYNFSANVARTFADLHGSALSYVCATLGQYKFRITTSGGVPTSVSDSDETGIDVVAVPDVTPPAKCTAFTATDQAKDGLAKLAWTDPVDADLHTIGIAHSSVSATEAAARANAKTFIDYAPAGTQEFYAANLTNDVPHYFAVNPIDTSANARNDITAGEAKTVTPTVPVPDYLIALAGTVDIYETATRRALFTLGQIVGVEGQVEPDANVAGCAVAIVVRDLSTLAAVATLYSGTTSLVADDPKTFEEIAGAPLTWTPTAVGAYRIDADFTGGTPAVKNPEIRSQFVVLAAGAGGETPSAYTTIAAGYIDTIMGVMGETITYAPSTGGSLSLVAQVDRNPSASQISSDGKFQEQQCTVSVRVSDVAIPNIKDHISLTPPSGDSEEPWSVENWDNDSAGLWIITCSRTLALDRRTKNARRGGNE